MILVHRDQEITFFNDKTNKFYTSRQGMSGPTRWDYKKFFSSGLQSPVGYDLLGWWLDD